MYSFPLYSRHFSFSDLKFTVGKILGLKLVLGRRVIRVSFLIIFVIKIIILVSKLSGRWNSQMCIIFFASLESCKSFCLQNFLNVKVLSFTIWKFFSPRYRRDTHNINDNNNNYMTIVIRKAVKKQKTLAQIPSETDLPAVKKT